MYKEKNKLRQKKILKLLFKFLIAAYFTFIAIKFYSTIMINFNKETELKNLQNDLNKLKNENQQLQNQIDLGITDDYAFSRARSELNFVDPLERVFVNIPIENDFNPKN